MRARWPRLDAIAFGGDYNPEQWPEEVWDEDVKLMREAGVNLVSVGIFAWGMLEPEPGRYEFGWLDRVLGLLHDSDISVDLGVPVAAPAPWFLHTHPEARPVTRDGQLLGGGSRQAYCPSSPAYAAATAAITEQLARRYGDHPALVLWHVGNEYGAGQAECYCERSAQAFRDWLRDRYGDIGLLNKRWGTAFWSQRVTTWDEIDVPRTSTSVVNPAQRLDFARFCSDALLQCFCGLRDILHRISPDVPVTTNFMANNCKSMDYWRWAPEVDVISNDNYLIAERTDGYLDLAMSADLTRSLAGGAPWLLMEHSTSAVSWQPRNIAKEPGEMRRNTVAHLARGADGLLFFQWRASRYGAEKFHSAMLPHGGTRTRIWREVTELGQELAELDDIRGGRVEADLAILWDWESWWALELEWRPSIDLDYYERVRAWYEATWRAGLTSDFAHPEADLSGYPLVLVPSLYLITPAAAVNLRDYVSDGGTLLVGHFSGIADANDVIYPGPYPGALREVLGLTVEEWLPLRKGDKVTLSWEQGQHPDGTADSWTEAVRLSTADAILRYASGPASGAPAVTRHRFGAGQAWYVSARTDSATTARILAAARAESRAVPATGTPLAGGESRLEVVRRGTGERRVIVLINHGDSDATVLLSGLPSGEPDSAAPVTVPAGGVVVVRTKHNVRYEIREEESSG